MGITTEATNLTKSERITQVAEKPKLAKATFVDVLFLIVRKNNLITYSPQAGCQSLMPRPWRDIPQA